MAGKRDQPERKTRISLVLGSGGARGYAHIGVIKELEAQGYEIGSIAGSSMGALIGGVYAAGKLDAYRDWVSPLERMDVFRLLDWTLSGGGFIKGNRIIDALRDLVGATDIEDLPIPYTAVAVDIDAQREVWFSSGPLFDAIRASIAIPTLLRPAPLPGTHPGGRRASQPATGRTHPARPHRLHPGRGRQRAAGAGTRWRQRRTGITVG